MLSISLSFVDFFCGYRAETFRVASTLISGLDGLVMIITPFKGIADTLDIIMQYGTGPTTAVQVDHRVTRSLTMCGYYY